MACKDCGYYVREPGAEGSTIGSTGYSATGNAGYSAPESAGYNVSGSVGYGAAPQPQNSQQPTGSQPNPAVQPYTYRPANSTNPSGAGNKGGTGSGAKIATVVGGILVFLVVVAVGALKGYLSAYLGSRPSQEPWRPSELLEDAVIATNTPAPSSNDSPGTQGQSSDRNDRYMPQSSFFREMAEIVFGKACANISREEFASVTALVINLDDKDIYCQVNNDEIHSMTITSAAGMDLSDLKFFPGLEYISLVGDSLESGDLDGLERLTAVYAENTLDELYKIIPRPENITTLSVTDSFFKRDLEGVQNFPNLLYLTVAYDHLEDISALNDMPGLLGLALLDCDYLMDYSPLMNMTNLEQLSIQSSQLKTIDFIKVMPNLTYLGVEDSQILNIDAVANCPKLTELYLMKNYSVDDYTPVGDLVNLTDLTIHKDTHAPIPSLGNLTNLVTASFGNLWEDELPLVTAASNISQLYLEHNYDDDHLELLADLPLTTLSMIDCSISGDHPLAFLTELADLTYLDLSESYIFGNIEEVFGIPGLQYLYLKETTGVIDFDNLPANEDLIVLYMSGLTIKTEPWGYEYYYLRDHYDMFEKYPNVEWLYLAELDIDNIEFVSNMPNLQYLDIIGNNVTSLKPLESLQNFYTVLCRNNSILESVSEESGIYVDMESHYYSYR